MRAERHAFVLIIALVALGCRDATAPAAALIGCHVLSTSELTNGSPAASSIIRFRSDRVVRVTSGAPVQTSGLNEGSWSLQDDTLRMSFGGGFVGVNYTLTRVVPGSVEYAAAVQWAGDLLFWVDTPVLNGEGTATLRRTRCR